LAEEWRSVAAFLDCVDAQACFDGRWYENRHAHRKKGREVRRQDQSKGVEGDGLVVVVRVLDFGLTWDVDVGRPVVMVVRAQVRVNERGVIVIMAAFVMDVLKRRKNEGRHECQTAWNRGGAAHKEVVYTGVGQTRAWGAHVAGGRRQCHAAAVWNSS